MPFSVLDVPEIENRITEDLSKITASVLALAGKRTSAVILTGGYGRGEGGVSMREGRMSPVNDYDLFIIADGVALPLFWHMRSKLRTLSHQLAERIGIGVDLALFRKESLPFLKPTLFWYETKMGHQVLLGNPRILDAVPTVTPSQIPLAEGARLLLNRGAMLLDALSRLRQQKESGEFAQDDTRRILTACWKAILSWGDCILLAQGEYHYLYRTRERAFLALSLPDGAPNSEDLKPLYQQAIRFKLFPDSTKVPLTDFEAWVHGVVERHEGILRWFERMRLGGNFENWREYAEMRKFPLMGPGEAIKNIVRNCLRFKTANGFRAWQWLLSHPEGRLLSTLPLLFHTHGEQLVLAREFLGGSGDWQDLSQRFLQAWH